MNRATIVATKPKGAVGDPKAVGVLPAGLRRKARATRNVIRVDPMIADPAANATTRVGRAAAAGCIPVPAAVELMASASARRPTRRSIIRGPPT